MKLSKITTVYFSPTGSTKRTATYITEQLSEQLKLPASIVSYTLPEEREKVHTFSSDELVIFASPVYAGRLPNKILPYVQNGFVGQNTPVLPFVTFGNRSFDNALSELCGELSAHGFQPFAGAAISSRHAFTDAIGTGRPDEADFRRINDFVNEVCRYLEEAKSLSAITVPGDWPDAQYYRPLGIDGNPAVFLKAKPQTNNELCDHCGACAKTCPMGAIDKENTAQVPGICIKCQSCVRNCHTHAKYFDDPAFLSHVQMLEKNYTERVESTFFLPRHKI